MLTQSLIALLMLAGTDPASAPPEDAAKAVELKRAERQICRQTTVLGSRVAQKVTCGTKAEWAIRERESKHFLDKSREGGLEQRGNPGK